MWWVLLACAGTGDEPHAHGDAGHTGHDTSGAALRVEVLLDGAPAAGALLSQPGTSRRWTTGDDGSAQVELDLGVEGELALTASLPQARIGGDSLSERDLEAGTFRIELVSFSTADNLAYEFQDPGAPDRRDSTAQCAHCHGTMTEDWFASPHRSAASNPWLHDLYAGVASAVADEAGCQALGGEWLAGVQPGTGKAAMRCYVGQGVLPALNDCGEEAPCDQPGAVAGATGACADCHAPGIDGTLGGRDLLEARGQAHESGVHCDTCHKVEAVDLDATAPGVAGRLRILRPSEPIASKALGPYAPLTFGPLPDVLNPRMGSVLRSHYTDGTLCAGCHEYDQPALLPGESLDLARWPEGRLPVHSTWSELESGPLGTAIPCNACHMPPDAGVRNAADLGHDDPEAEPGITNGWDRPPGSVRRHSWFGPRSEEQRMLDLAAWIELRTERVGEELVVQATVHNSGPGHALPTGEPLRSLVLRVEATCDGTPLRPTGGDVVPDYGDAFDLKEAGEDWSRWPGASPGEVIRVVRRTGSWRDYTGVGPFGDGRFSAEDKGLPVEEWVGESTILAVDGDLVELDAPLPAGDRAYRASARTLPDGDAPQAAWAGAPGMAFARLMVGADGARGVPHFLAIDVASDNRIPPGGSWTSTHRFEASCDSPTAGAFLLYRPAPLRLARERGWEALDLLIAETWR